MVDIWDGIKDTVSSLGGAAVAPAGAVWDIASAPFDSDDDSLREIFLRRGGDMLDPLVNNETITGNSIGRVMDGLNAALDYGVNRPISTLSMASMHSASEGGTWDRIEALFDGNTWAEAWKKSDDTNAGQAIATQGLGNIGGPLSTPGAIAGLVLGGGGQAIDPFEYENPYDEWTHPNYGGRATALSWGTNVTGALLLDPAYLGLKALGAARTGALGAKLGSETGQFGAGAYGKMTAAQRAELGTVLNGGSAKASKRVDRWADFVAGKNREGRALTAPEVLAATPELNRWAKEPRTIAALVADASKIENPALRRNTVKDILAVAGGDVAALDNLRSAKAAIPSLADELKNMRKGNVLDLERMAANPALAQSPQFIRHLEGQLTRLNADGGIDKVLRSWEERLDLLSKTAGQMTHLPGLHGRQAGKAVARLNDKGAVRTVARKAGEIEDAAIAKVDEWTSKAASRSAHSVMFQKGLRTVPVLAIKTTAFAAAPYTKFPAAFGNAMRQTHFTGVARFDEWDDAVTQLDSMLKLSHADNAERMKLITRASLAGGEMEKERVVHEAERMAMKSLTRHLGTETGENISESYVTELMEGHFRRRKASMSQLYGRAYAATEMTAQQTDQVASQAALRGRNVEKLADANKQWNLRVDQFLDDDGIPVALPLLESQLRNAMPLLDMHLAKQLVKRDQSQLARLGRAWERQSMEIENLNTMLGKAKGAAAQRIAKRLEQAYDAQDWTREAGAKMLRVWKMSVLFRLGYPARVVLDDHWRIWSRIGAARFYADNVPETFRNFGYNQVGRRKAGRIEMANARAELAYLKAELNSDRILNYEQRLAEHRKATRALAGHRGQVSKLEREANAEQPALGFDPEAVAQKADAQGSQIARWEAEVDRLQQQLGDMSPQQIQARIAELEGLLKGGAKALRPDKRTVGSADLTLSGGEVIPGAFGGPQGRAYRGVTSSGDTFDYQIKGVEDRMYGRADRGAHVTINPDAPNHLDAWADALNNSIRSSRVAMYFVKGGKAEDFPKWLKSPEQADLRRRLPHLAHSPEEWAMRVESMVLDYIPNSAVRDALKKGTVSPKWLDKNVPQQLRSAVHGPMVADTLGTSDRTLGIGRAINDMFSWIAATPTDRLSRHPFFNSMYKMHAEDFAEMRRVAAHQQGRKFTQEDLDFIERQARRAALADLKRTLFDMSAHSHAAHVMRFVSPFFAAHQEVLQRWGRIVQENPGIIRRAQMAFDAPRYAGLVVDENGDPVEPGEMPSPKHKILLPIPFTGGADWSVNENSFNLILQNGVTNPGVGPLVQVPLEYMASRYPEDEEIARVARLFSPFPPDSPADAMLPATFKRLAAVIHGTTGVDTYLGTREFNDLYATNITDRVVDFQVNHGREPSQAEMDGIWEAAKQESITEAFMRFVQNAGSPFPARPNSRYAAIQQGWYKLSEMGRQRYPEDFTAAREWATEKFKEQYGEAYLALTFSDTNNKAGVSGAPAEVAAYKRYRGVLDKTDPRLVRGVIGPAVTALDEQGVSTERTDEGRNWFEDQGVITQDDPETAATEAQARRGWAMLDDITNRLNLMAEQQGLGSYVESEELVAVRRAALEKIKAENEAFKADIESVDGDSYDSLLREMQQLVENPQLRDDPTRTDITTLEAYLMFREQVMDLIDRRQAAGLGGPDAQATEPIRLYYTQVVGKLAAQNTFFESGFWSGVIENDPLLIGAQ